MKATYETGYSRLAGPVMLRNKRLWKREKTHKFKEYSA